MIIMFHISKTLGEELKNKGRSVTLIRGLGLIEIDTNIVSNAELIEIGMDRQKLDEFLALLPRKLEAEMDELRAEVEILKAG